MFPYYLCITKNTYISLLIIFCIIVCDEKKNVDIVLKKKKLDIF